MMAGPEPPAEAPKETTEITPELVRQVAEKVYALWLRDLKLARERKRFRRDNNGF